MALRSFAFRSSQRQPLSHFPTSSRLALALATFPLRRLSSSNSTSNNNSSRRGETKFSSTKFWDSLALDYDATFYAAFAERCAPTLVDEVVRGTSSAFPSTSALRVVDIGAGTGHLASLLVHRMPSVQVTSVDSSAAMISLLSLRSLPRVHVGVMDAHMLDLPTGEAHAAVLAFALQFASDRAQGGSLIVSTWAPLPRCSLASLYFSLLDELFGGDSARSNPNFGPLSDSETLRSEVECAGFTEVKVRSQSRAIDFSKEPSESVARMLTAAARATLESKGVQVSAFYSKALKKVEAAKAKGAALEMTALIVTARRAKDIVPSEKRVDMEEDQGEVLNRARTFFYLVDAQGRIWRKELSSALSAAHSGEVRQDRFRDEFFARLRRNTSGEYEELFPYLTTRGRERYYVMASHAPIVFWDLQDENSEPNSDSDPKGEGSLVFGATLNVPFEPRRLALLEVSESSGGESLLSHPISVPFQSLPSDAPEAREELRGVFERHLQYALLGRCATLEDGQLAWRLKSGELVPIPRVPHIKVTQEIKGAQPDARFSERRSAWWLRDE